MFGSFGWMELLLILFIVLIISGAGKLPQLGEGVGKAMKCFKRSVNEAELTTEDAIRQEEACPTTPVTCGRVLHSTKNSGGKSE